MKKKLNQLLQLSPDKHLDPESMKLLLQDPEMEHIDEN